MATGTELIANVRYKLREQGTGVLSEAVALAAINRAYHYITRATKCYRSGVLSLKPTDDTGSYALSSWTNGDRLYQVNDIWYDGKSLPFVEWGTFESLYPNWPNESKSTPVLWTMPDANTIMLFNKPTVSTTTVSGITVDSSSGSATLAFSADPRASVWAGRCLVISPSSNPITVYVTAVYLDGATWKATINANATRSNTGAAFYACGTIQIEGYSTAADLTANTSPVFPATFHSVIEDAACSDLVVGFIEEESSQWRNSFFGSRAGAGIEDMRKQVLNRADKTPTIGRRTVGLSYNDLGTQMQNWSG